MSLNEERRFVHKWGQDARQIRSQSPITKIQTDCLWHSLCNLFVLMRPDYHAFFTTYVDSYNQALTGKLDVELIQSFFADTFLAVGPETVSTGKNGFFFSILLKKGYAFYKKIGTRHLRITKLAVTVIDYFHDMVKVQYNANYVKKTGESVSINFEVSYFVRHPDEVPKIFGFVAGDEMRMYKEAGLV